MIMWIYNSSCFITWKMYFDIVAGVIAFAFNAESFAIAILVFFLFFLLVTFSWRSAEKLFSKRFLVSYQENVWPRSDSFLGHTKMSFRKYCSTSCYSRRVWHMTQLMHGNQHSKHPKKYKKQSARNSERSKPVDGRRYCLKLFILLLIGIFGQTAEGSLEEI